MKLIVLSAILVLMGSVAAAHNAKVFFIEPKNNAVVGPTFKVKMGLKGMIVCEANIETKDKKCGHHHIIIDGKFVPAGQPVAKDETHIHYGKKQTETELTLSPGKHSLTLQFADFAHLSYGEKFSETITVEVK
ncbi:MAG: DUF4399 domain-containing protein [Bdellovibrionota bacterium]